jgi:hypothetical protein
MKNLFGFAEACLHSDTIDEKLALTHQALSLLENGELSLISDQPVLPVAQVKFPGTA